MSPAKSCLIITELKAANAVGQASKMSLVDVSFSTTVEGEAQVIVQAMSGIVNMQA